jgi:hypothetical protein
MDKPKLKITSVADVPQRLDGRTEWPVNVCQGDTASTLTARMWKDGWTNYYSLGHYPSTAILIEYDNEDGNYAP